MGGHYVGNAASFLIETVFGLYILIVLLRLLLQTVRADFYNPLSQFVVKATQPVLRPVRRLIPGYAGLDLASITVLLALKSVELALISTVIGITPHVAGLLVLALAELLGLTINVFLFSILIQVVLSWVSPGTYNPLTTILFALNEPLLGRARRLVRPVGGLDLSPLVVLVVLQLTTLLLITPLRDIGRGLL